MKEMEVAADQQPGQPGRQVVTFPHFSTHLHPSLSRNPKADRLFLSLIPPSQATLSRNRKPISIAHKSDDIYIYISFFPPAVIPIQI